VVNSLDVELPLQLGKSLGDLPASLQKLVKDQLKEGEQIRWLDQPVAKAYAWRKAGCAALGMVLSIISVFAVIAILRSDQPFLENVPIIVFFVGGSLFSLSAPLWGYQLARRTVYVITDRRVACFAPWIVGGVRWSLPLVEIGGVIRSIWNGRTDSLHVTTSPVMAHVEDDGCTMHCIPNAACVKDLILHLTSDHSSRKPL
jgi:hypothetical protein